MPLYPSSISLTILGTTTAGDTAASTEPRIRDSNGLESKSVGASNKTTNNSNVAGRKHIKMAGLPSFLKADKSSPKPALVKMMIRAIFLRSPDIAKILGSNRFKTQGPSIIPVSNMPIRLGSFSFWQIYPRDIPNNNINDMLNNMYVISLL